MFSATMWLTTSWCVGSTGLDRPPPDTYTHTEYSFPRTKTREKKMVTHRDQDIHLWRLQLLLHYQSKEAIRKQSRNVMSDLQKTRIFGSLKIGRPIRWGLFCFGFLLVFWLWVGGESLNFFIELIESANEVCES